MLCCGGIHCLVLKLYSALSYIIVSVKLCEGLIGHITAFTLFHCLMFSEFFFFFFHCLMFSEFFCLMLYWLRHNVV